jgi:hypothetical protein
LVELVGVGQDGRFRDTAERGSELALPRSAVDVVRYMACLITIVTNVNVAVPAFPVTCSSRLWGR